MSLMQSENDKKVEELGRTREEQRAEEAKASLASLREIRALRSERLEAIESNLTTLRSLRSKAGAARKALDPEGEVSGAPDLFPVHRAMQRATRFAFASDTGGHGPDYPGLDPVDHGPEWLRRLERRRGAVADVEARAERYVSAMRADLAHQSATLVAKYSDAIASLETDRDALQVKIARTDELIAKRQSGPSLSGDK